MKNGFLCTVLVFAGLLIEGCDSGAPLEGMYSSLQVGSTLDQDAVSQLTALLNAETKRISQAVEARDKDFYIPSTEHFFFAELSSVLAKKTHQPVDIERAFDASYDLYVRVPGLLRVDYNRDEDTDSDERFEAYGGEKRIVANLRSLVFQFHDVLRTPINERLSEKTGAHTSPRYLSEQSDVMGASYLRPIWIQSRLLDWISEIDTGAYFEGAYTGVVRRNQDTPFYQVTITEPETWRYLTRHAQSNALFLRKEADSVDKELSTLTDNDSWHTQKLLTRLAASYELLNVVDALAVAKRVCDVMNESPYTSWAIRDSALSYHISLVRISRAPCIKRLIDQTVQVEDGIINVVDDLLRVYAPSLEELHSWSLKRAELKSGVQRGSRAIFRDTVDPFHKPTLSYEDSARDFYRSRFCSDKRVLMEIAYARLIGLGDYAWLGDALFRCGDRYIAQSYVNSISPVLRKAGEAWAKHRGYDLIPAPY